MRSRTALRVLFEIDGIEVIDTEEPGGGAAPDRHRGRRRRDPGHELRADTRRARRASRCSARSARSIPDLPVMLLTAWTSLETAVELVKAGAADYLAKPWDDSKLLAHGAEPARACASCTRRTSRAARASDNRARARARADATTCAASVYAEPAMQQVVALACQVARVGRAGADHRAQRLRQGEARRDRAGQLRGARTGRSSRSTAGALPAELIEAELFGAEAGAYTGATRRARASSRPPTAARCSSTRSATCRWPAR